MLLTAVLYVCLLCILTVSACIRDWASIGGRCSFQTRHLLEHGHPNPRACIRGWHCVYYKFYRIIIIIIIISANKHCITSHILSKLPDFYTE